MAFPTHIQYVLHLTSESLPIVFSLNLPFSFLVKQFPFNGFSFRVETQFNSNLSLGADILRQNWTLNQHFTDELKTDIQWSDMIYLDYRRDPCLLILNSVEFCDILHLNEMLRDQAIMELTDNFGGERFSDQVDFWAVITN